jgi:putative oxidoreductase
MSYPILPRSWAPPLLSVLRIIVGLLLLEDGTGKLIGFPFLSFVAEMPAWLHYFTGTMEFIGGVLMILGLFTRPAAFVLSGYMAVAYFMVHFPKSFFPAVNGGVPAVLFCFVFLYLAVAGPGAWAIDKD